MCRRWGASCGLGCKCSGCDRLTGKCRSPITNCTAELFGEDNANLRLTPCVTDGFEKYHKKSLHKPSLADLEAKLLQDTRVFEGKLLNDLKQFQDTPDITADDRKLQEWYMKYKTFEQSQCEAEWPVEKKKHMQWLFQYAFAVEERTYKEYHFSYCRGEWYTDLDHELDHCSDCKTCRDRYWWHCGVCRKCNVHFKAPCDTCGGLSSTMADVRNGRI